MKKKKKKRKEVWREEVLKKLRGVKWGGTATGEGKSRRLPPTTKKTNTNEGGS